MKLKSIWFYFCADTGVPRRFGESKMDGSGDAQAVQRPQRSHLRRVGLPASPGNSPVRCPAAGRAEPGDVGRRQRFQKDRWRFVNQKTALPRFTNIFSKKRNRPKKHYLEIRSFPIIQGKNTAHTHFLFKPALCSLSRNQRKRLVIIARLSRTAGRLIPLLHLQVRRPNTRSHLAFDPKKIGNRLKRQALV